MTAPGSAPKQLRSISAIVEGTYSYQRLLDENCYLPWPEVEQTGTGTVLFGKFPGELGRLRSIVVQLRLTSSTFLSLSNLDTPCEGEVRAFSSASLVIPAGVGLPPHSLSDWRYDSEPFALAPPDSFTCPPIYGGGSAACFLLGGSEHALAIFGAGGALDFDLYTSPPGQQHEMIAASLEVDAYAGPAFAVGCSGWMQEEQISARAVAQITYVYEPN